MSEDVKTYTDGCMNFHSPDDDDAFCPYCEM